MEPKHTSVYLEICTIIVRGAYSKVNVSGIAALIECFFQRPVSFVEITLYFNSEEWALLSPCQRHLYDSIMMENYENIIFLGKEDPSTLN